MNHHYKEEPSYDLPPLPCTDTAATVASSSDNDGLNRIHSIQLPSAQIWTKISDDNDEEATVKAFDLQLKQSVNAWNYNRQRNNMMNLATIKVMFEKNNINFAYFDNINNKKCFIRLLKKHDIPLAAVDHLWYNLGGVPFRRDIDINKKDGDIDTDLNLDGLAIEIIDANILTAEKVNELCYDFSGILERDMNKYEEKEDDVTDIDINLNKLNRNSEQNVDDAVGIDKNEDDDDTITSIIEPFDRLHLHQNIGDAQHEEPPWTECETVSDQDQKDDDNDIKISEANQLNRALIDHLQREYEADAQQQYDIDMIQTSLSPPSWIKYGHRSQCDINLYQDNDDTKQHVLPNNDNHSNNGGEEKKECIYADIKQSVIPERQIYTIVCEYCRGYFTGNTDIIQLIIFHCKLFLKRGIIEQDLNQSNWSNLKLVGSESVDYNLINRKWIMKEYCSIALMRLNNSNNNVINNLIPIAAIDGHHIYYGIEWVLIVPVVHRNCNVGLAFRYNEKTDVFVATTTYCDEREIESKHKLIGLEQSFNLKQLQFIDANDDDNKSEDEEEYDPKISSSLEIQSDYEDDDIHDDNCNYQQMVHYKEMYELEQLKNHHLQQQKLEQQQNILDEYGGFDKYGI